ncbi:hypothetical protein GCM10010508_63530 [Streptomyces naganishii JCM 4654]|uniref:Gram-positive cocci surface proteins LPxTG domain-containing protein n=1 Tax=Streptomyces naganishii JCM 4654 TaxID=1306179 RepID=A0A918Y9P3_9ACTN|nr:hypothetical protein GCM10010508_63530 [Streptomyces naganishii JCM 4654]
MKKMATSSRWRVALASAASAALLVAAPLAAAQSAHAQPYPPAGPILTVGSTTVTAGDSLSFSSTSVFEPGSLVTALLESRPIVLGRFRADATGAVSGTVTIPRTAPTGWHVLRLTSDRPDRSVGVSIYVQGPIGSTPSPSPTPPHHPSPEPPGEPEHPGGHDHGGADDGRGPDYTGGHDHGGADDGRGPAHAGARPHEASLANTGSNDKTLALGGAAAALLVTGGGTVLAVRRRRNS